MSKIKELQKEIDRMKAVLDSHTLVLAHMFDRGLINKLEYGEYLQRLSGGET